MIEALISAGAAVVVGLLSLIGVAITNSRSNDKMQNDMKTAQAVTDERISELTREVRMHNDFARRIPVICSQHPGCNGNNTGGCCKQLHGNLTLAPSLWTDRELRKYHYRLHLSLPSLSADKLKKCKFYRSLPLWKIVAHSLRGSDCSDAGNVPVCCIFSFQGS